MSSVCDINLARVPTLSVAGDLILKLVDMLFQVSGFYEGLGGKQETRVHVCRFPCRTFDRG